MESDLALIIAIAGTGIAMIGVVLAMMFWVRSESNALRGEAKEDRRDLLDLVRSIELEMKDFHYKLIEIEKNRKAQ